MMIFLSILCLLILVVMLSACRAASIADEHMEHAFAEWLEDHPEKKAEFQHLQKKTAARWEKVQA